MEKNAALPEREWTDEQLEVGLARLKEMHILVCIGSFPRQVSVLIDEGPVPPVATQHSRYHEAAYETS